MSNRKFIETELKENPEFFKAFPHLQPVFEESNLAEGEETYLGVDRNYLENKVVNFSQL